MKNPEKLTTLSTQDTGPRKTKQKTQHKKLKRREARTPSKPGDRQKHNTENKKEERPWF
jgi:hypothetical protein